MGVNTSGGGAKVNKSLVKMTNQGKERVQPKFQYDYMS